MASIESYKREIQNASKGDQSLRQTICNAFRVINADGPSAETFEGKTEEYYVKSKAVPGHPYTETLEYRMNQLFDLIKKTNVPSTEGLASWLLTTKGILQLTGRLDQYPK